jgi:predicted N-formylglutamate amidohydrolase
VSAPGIFVTCEHAWAKVPAGYDGFFAGATEVLHTHRAYDPGALEVAELLSEAVGCEAPLAGEFTRLLIDLNRSLAHPQVFSAFSPPSGHGLRRALVELHRQFRERTLDRLRYLISRHGAVVHYSVHTFTPVLDRIQRNADIGLLYDPGRAGEAALCKLILQDLNEGWPDLRVRLNYPYRGVADGHTKSLRRILGTPYAGIEIELNHGSFFADSGKWQRMTAAIVKVIATVSRGKQCGA